MSEADWTGLAEAIRLRLAATGAGPGEIARATGLSRETVRPILNGVPGNYRPHTLRKVSIALGWSGDTIEQLLAGAPPPDQPINLPMIEEANTESELLAAVRDLTEVVRELREDMRRGRR